MKVIFKKLLAIFILCLLTTNLSYGFGLSFDGAKQVFKADLQSQRVPAGKHIKIQFLNDINTVRSLAGDQFSATLAEDIIVNKEIILPQGTIMRGVVENIKESLRPKAPAVLYLGFDHIVTPIGKQVPVTLHLANVPNITTQGGLSAGGSYYDSLEENWESSKDMVRKSVEFGLNTGDVAKYLVTPISAVGGFGVSSLVLFGKSIVNLFQKGNEVIITQGSTIDTVLSEPLDIPTH